MMRNQKPDVIPFLNAEVYNTSESKIVIRMSGDSETFYVVQNEKLDKYVLLSPSPFSRKYLKGDVEVRIEWDTGRTVMTRYIEGKSDG